MDEEGEFRRVIPALLLGVWTGFGISCLNHEANSHWAFASTLLSVALSADYAYKQPKGHQVSMCIATFLGTVHGAGIAITLFTLHWKHFGMYWITWSLFHTWEYMFVALFHPAHLSFLLNHSWHYLAAFVVGWTEYLIEVFYLGYHKDAVWMTAVGAVLVSGGQACRTVAMYTAGSNFLHSIRNRREAGHVLVTNGIYTYLRHPAYFGWFYWAVGTQFLLHNPVSILLYALAAWKFFHDRIPYEEMTLVAFFGEKYIKYCNSTFIGIPFIPSRIQ